MPPLDHKEFYIKDPLNIFPPPLYADHPGGRYGRDVEPVDFHGDSLREHGPVPLRGRQLGDAPGERQAHPADPEPRGAL